jgi:hypothetical protein
MVQEREEDAAATSGIFFFYTFSIAFMTNKDDV